jgi:ABC-type dipeptide/oligopeptide/nickel transport system permease subunit
MRRLFKSPLVTVAFAITVCLCTVALLAPAVSPKDPLAMDFRAQLSPPSRTYFLGADSFGRDVLSRLLHGARISLGISLASVALAVGIGLPLGCIAGYVGRLTDEFLMNLADGLLSLPPLVIAVALVGILGPSMRNVIFALTLVYAPRFARLSRATVLSLRDQDFVQAVRALGAKDRRILVKHIVPNTLAPILVLTTVTFGQAVIAESGLSFLGLGVQPPTPTWGSMLSESRTFIQQAPWLPIFPGLVIMLAVLALNVLGDGVRDAMDPKLRSR